MQLKWCEDDDKCTFIVLVRHQDADVHANAHDLTAFRGKGHGTEATQLLMNYGVAKLNVQRYTAKISAKNEASIGLFTKKLGFRQTGFSEVFQEVALERPVDSSDLTPVGQALIRPLTLLYNPVEM
ncbi:N-acetyltransferase 9 [Tieghemiomyces parasiticus]|uniref:N-acetyltransferase 9 n=1 Tax=Tieghemiomyces parasiticus TaxID=78921 RepID=A0A9W7ZL20_9FUNG|nr:N-acetyltransferase 9 [Tieghemiomyces parasiticus]